MTPQEQQLLQGLTDRVNQTVLQEKDPEAEQYLQQALSRNPDATYILAQTVLVQQYALDQAKKQLDDAKQQLAQQAQPPKHSGSFLSNLLGNNDDAQRQPPPPPPQYVPVNNPPAYQQPQYGQPQYAPPQYGQPQYGQPQYGQPAGGGFLRSAMQTATGVAAGALAFEGIESLMHGFGEHAGYGPGFGGGGYGGGYGGGPREEVVNNYYNDSPSQDRGDLSDRFQAAGDQPSADIEDRRDQTFADPGLDGSNQNDLVTDDQDFDYGSADDSSDTGSDFSSDDNS